MDKAQAMIWAAAGTGFIFVMTCLGSAVVFLFRRDVGRTLQTVFLGFAAGIMIAASVFGLLVPSIAEATARGGYPRREVSRRVSGSCCFSTG